MLQVIVRLIIGAAALFAAGYVQAADIKTGTFKTNDGYTLNYLEAGNGPTIVLIPGWSQTAAEFKDQFDLADRFHVIAIDMRGNGGSSKGSYGYRIQRMSKDVHDFLVEKKLEDVTLVGHSMGSSIIWGYWDLFRNDRVRKIVLDDQIATCTAYPSWSAEQRAQIGASRTPDLLYAAATDLQGANGEELTKKMLSGMFSKSFPKDEFDWVVAENMKLPREQAARLLINHCTNDWRDILPTINVPTLIIGGDASFNKRATHEWLTSQIPGARLVWFGADEGGSHFSFMENPKKFNAVIADFVK